MLWSCRTDYTDAYFLYVLYCIAFKKSTEGNQVIKLFSSQTHEQEVMEGNEQEIGWKGKNMFPASWKGLCHRLADAGGDAFFCLSSPSSCWTWCAVRWLGSSTTLPMLCMLLYLLAFLFPKRCLSLQMHGEPLFFLPCLFQEHNCSSGVLPIGMAMLDRRTQVAEIEGRSSSSK